MQFVGIFVYLSIPIALASIEPQVEQYASFQYVLKVINHLSHSKTGQFKLLIFNYLPTNSSSHPYEHLLQALPSNAVSQFIIDGLFEVTYTNIPHIPSLIIIHLDNAIIEPAKRLWMSLYILDCNSYVMVLVDLTKPELMKLINRILTKWRFNYVVYMSTALTGPKIIRVDYAGQPEEILTRYPHPSQLFRSTVHNMNKQPLIYTVTVGSLPYRDYLWIEETARFINATRRIVRSPCTVGDLKGCRMKLFYTDDLDVCLDHFHLSEMIPEIYRELFNVVPMAEVFLVPKRRHLNVLELFAKPFSWEVWMALVIVLIAIESCALAFPRMFRNDPVMYLVCGFERGALHSTGRFERFTFLPLIVFFFLLTNAYETKIISFLTEKPALSDVKTIDQMLATGIKIKLNMQYWLKVARDPQLSPHLINSTETIDQMDGVSAYLTDRDEAKVAIRRRENYDSQLNRPRYIILKESRRMQLFSFWVNDKSPLLEVLYYTQKVFFESGILEHWEQKEIEGEKRYYTDVQWVSQKGMQFDDLVPAWASLGVGSLLSSALFMIEIVVNALTKNKPSGEKVFCE